MSFRNFAHLGRVTRKGRCFGLEPGQPLDRHGIIALLEGTAARYVMDGRIDRLLARRHDALAAALAEGRVVDLWFRDMPDLMAAAFTAQEIYTRMALDWQPGQVR